MSSPRRFWISMKTCKSLFIYVHPDPVNTRLGNLFFFQILTSHIYSYARGISGKIDYTHKNKLTYSKLLMIRKNYLIL